MRTIYRFDKSMNLKDAAGNLCNPDKESWVPEAPQFVPDIGEFQSPIDGSLISSRTQLREHERRHNVIQCGRDQGNIIEKTKAKQAELFKTIGPSGWIDS